MASIIDEFEDVPADVLEFENWRPSHEGSHKLGSGDLLLLLPVAVFFDGMQLVLMLSSLAGSLVAAIPILGWFMGAAINATGAIIGAVLSIFAWLTFFTWFKIKGIDLGSAKRAIRIMATTLVETIPYVAGILPTWTVVILYTYYETRKEEREKST